MIKEHGKYTINGEEAVFTATFIKKLFKTFPVGIFTFKDGREIQITHDILSGETTYSESVTPNVIYANGYWDFE